jgi:hypothetical protein
MLIIPAVGYHRVSSRRFTKREVDEYRSVFGDATFDDLVDGFERASMMSATSIVRPPSLTSRRVFSKKTLCAIRRLPRSSRLGPLFSSPY